MAFLEEAHGCCRLYIGDQVLQELRRRGLPETRENERIVRSDVRSREGTAAFVRRASKTIESHLESDNEVLIDAIYAKAEWDILREIVGAAELHLIFIECSRNVRAERLSKRPVRPFDLNDLERRDKLEREELAFDGLRRISNATINNMGTLDQLKTETLIVYARRSSVL